MGPIGQFCVSLLELPLLNLDAYSVNANKSEDSPNLKELHREMCQYLWNPATLVTSLELQVSMTLLRETSSKKKQPSLPIGARWGSELITSVTRIIEVAHLVP